MAECSVALTTGTRSQDSEPPSRTRPRPTAQGERQSLLRRQAGLGKEATPSTSDTHSNIEALLESLEELRFSVPIPPPLFSTTLQSFSCFPQRAVKVGQRPACNPAEAENDRQHPNSPIRCQGEGFQSSRLCDTPAFSAQLNILYKGAFSQESHKAAG